MSFSQKCPQCRSKGNLRVVQYTLSATGQVVEDNARLEADGFEVNAPDDLKDCSTEDEVVKCSACGGICDLGVLSGGEVAGVVTAGHMPTAEEIAAYALDKALRYHFANVDDANWPDNPVATLEKGSTSDGDKEMEMWPPFEGRDAEDLLDLVLGMADCYETAMKWAQGRK